MSAIVIVAVSWSLSGYIYIHLWILSEVSGDKREVCVCAGGRGGGAGEKKNIQKETGESVKKKAEM